MQNSEPKVDFGYQQVPLTEKANKVADVFNSVATHYDLMNDLMSFGVHRWWKNFTVSLSQVRTGQNILDLAGGTGDLASQFAARVGKQGHVYLVDINAAMLNTGRDRLINAGLLENIRYIQADAEQLPFENNSFDCISIAFGLRNVTRKEAALQSMYRVLKPGGQLLILEFSRPIIPILKKMYDAYSFSLLPKLGEWVAGDADSYQYLAESIRMHPDQETLKTMALTAGFDQCKVHNLTGGIVAVHHAWKY